jgi:hypothetical protein
MSGSKFGSTPNVLLYSATGMWHGVIRNICYCGLHVRPNIEWLSLRRVSEAHPMRNERDVFLMLITISAKFCNFMFFGRKNIKVTKSNPFQAICK